MGRSIAARIATSVVCLHLYSVGYMWASIGTLEENFMEPWIALRVRPLHDRADTSTMRTPTAITYGTLPQDFVPKIYQGRGWDVAPIVVEEYNLLFFTQGKVACTEFKKLLRRMMNLTDWSTHKEPKIPHNPMFNGLKYLYMYPLPRAIEMLTDPDWTRAIFVREPKERILSAFLDKAAKKEGVYVDRHCCPNEIGRNDSCGKRASTSLHDFMMLIQDHCCCDPHWKPQSRRIDPELWQYVNFVGYFDSLHDDGKRMLQRLGGAAWETFGASGWGQNQNESMFFESSHSNHRTGAHTKAKLYFNDSAVVKLVEDIYTSDYDRFNFARARSESRGEDIRNA